MQRSRIEQMFSAAFEVRRALQRRARARAKAYWAATHERQRNPAAVRKRLGLSRTSFEAAAYAHLDGAPHLRRHCTKALAMHIADNVWSAVERHLFKDARGDRQGLVHVGKWHELTRLPGRARSHTQTNKWETFRLHGSLAGHRVAYAGTNERFMQPRRMHTVKEPADGWWHHEGPLVIVFSGLIGGSLVLPVRLPAAPCNQPILDHHLADSSKWHKVDLVRYRDPNAAGGWRYEAHLMVLREPYVARSVQAQRARAAIETIRRSAGIDVNVSNITVASHEYGRALSVTRVALDAPDKQKLQRAARKQARRKRRLDRSRRAANPSQYQLSKRQEKRARRRAEAGLRPLQVVPAGPRITRADGKPVQAFRRDRLSNAYRREHSAAIADSRAAVQARRDHARQIAGALISAHGYQLTIEDCDLRAWTRQWGTSIAKFSPGVLAAAIEREARAVAKLTGIAGCVRRASTRTTALSQHCLCGARVTKPLSERTHDCTACGLRGDRDAIAATLAACIVFADPDLATSAMIDFALARSLLDAPNSREVLTSTLPYALGRQDVLSESNALTARDGSFVAMRSGHPTPSWWLGETWAWPRIQPQMRPALAVGPRWNVCEGEPTCSDDVKVGGQLLARFERALRHVRALDRSTGRATLQKRGDERHERRVCPLGEFHDAAVGFWGSELEA